MTITLAWLRQKKGSAELLIASDSRLRSCGAMDQNQKIFPLDRGDCCLAFCGDAQIAYPFFIQVGTALNNHIKTRSRAEDFSRVRYFVGQILNNLVSSWDLPDAEKGLHLSDARILFAGWSWIEARFFIGYFSFIEKEFQFNQTRLELGHPWRDNDRSLTFIGDYEEDYRRCLLTRLNNKYPRGDNRGPQYFDWDFEPLEALNELLKEAKVRQDLYLIGGAPQLVKVYPFGNSLPFVVRATEVDHYLLGRRLFDWEKTERPVIDLSTMPTKLLYPLGTVPVPSQLKEERSEEDIEGIAASSLIPTGPSGPTQS